jgi:hypothetical protein
MAKTQRNNENNRKRNGNEKWQRKAKNGVNEIKAKYNNNNEIMSM